MSGVDWGGALEPVPISALQHHAFCARQCALIHVDGAWSENLYTLRGTRVHERADEPSTALELGVRVERAMPLWHPELGLIGRADVVEFAPDGTPYPVEYKSGPLRPPVRDLTDPRAADIIQLCAQGICLERMLGRPVPAGALFHKASRARRVVELDAPLRARVVEVLAAVRATLTSTDLPAPVADARCRDCSLVDTCLPWAVRDLGRGAPDAFAILDS